MHLKYNNNILNYSYNLYLFTSDIINDLYKKIHSTTNDLFYTITSLKVFIIKSLFLILIFITIIVSCINIHEFEYILLQMMYNDFFFFDNYFLKSLSILNSFVLLFFGEKILVILYIILVGIMYEASIFIPPLMRYLGLGLLRFFKKSYTVKFLIN